MLGEEVVEIVARCEAEGIVVWLDGGWAVDAALGEQTRSHDDLDLVVELRQVTRLVSVLAEMGDVVGRGQPPESLELVDPSGQQVDVHPVVLTESGDGLYRMGGGEDWIYPAAGFAGEGRILDRSIRCLTPEVQILCHTGYEPHLSSYDHVWALSRRFGLRVPDEYRRPRESFQAR